MLAPDHHPEPAGTEPTAPILTIAGAGTGTNWPGTRRRAARRVRLRDQKFAPSSAPARCRLAGRGSLPSLVRGPLSLPVLLRPVRRWRESRGRSQQEAARRNTRIGLVSPHAVAAIETVTSVRLVNKRAASRAHYLPVRPAWQRTSRLRGVESLRSAPFAAEIAVRQREPRKTVTCHETMRVPDATMRQWLAAVPLRRRNACRSAANGRADSLPAATAAAARACPRDRSPPSS